MKFPFLIMIEIDIRDYGHGRIEWMPKYYSFPFDRGRFRRFGWLIFAVTFLQGMNLREYGQYLEDGKATWIE